MKYTCLASLAFFSLLSVAVLAQDAQSAQPPQQVSQVSTIPSSPQDQAAAMQAFQQGQQALSQELNALLAKGMTAQELMAWDQKNAARFQALADLAKSINAPIAMRPLPVASGSRVPQDAPQEIKDFETIQTDISNKFAQFHNQRLQAGINNQPGDEWTLFSQQNASELQTLQQQGKALAQKNAPQAMPLPGPTHLPVGMPPEMQAFAVAHDQIMREQTQLMNQYRTADAETKAAAMQQWQQTNAARLQQLQQLAGKASDTAVTTTSPIKDTQITPQANNQ